MWKGAGIALGAVALDYIHAGQTKFLLGWLLPHGAIEIPAILLAGQAGFILAGALIGWRQRLSLKARLRTVARDLVTLLAGLALWLSLVSYHPEDSSWNTAAVSGTLRRPASMSPAVKARAAAAVATVAV
jgi:hypothetical protein